MISFHLLRLNIKIQKLNVQDIKENIGYFGIITQLVAKSELNIIGKTKQPLVRHLLKLKIFE